MRAEVITLRDGQPSPTFVTSGVTGVIVAGGRDDRFAGMDRGFIHVGGRTLIKRVLEQLVLQVKQMLIVTRGNESLYAAYGLPVMADDAGSRDALSAIVSALGVIETSHALFVPADAARLPLDLSARLWQAHAQRGDAAPCFVRSAERALPGCCLVAKSDRVAAEQALAAGRTLPEWLASRQAVAVDFREWPAAFWGLASPKDIAPLESALRR